MTEVLDAMAVVRRHQQYPPVDARLIARDLGITVYETPLPENISGKLERDRLLSGKSGFTITVNSAHGPNRRRFTLAHEIAHFILHRYLIEGELSDDTLYRSGLPGPLETEANALAAEILMPRRLLESWHAQTPQLASLANAFQVSKEAMEIRLRMLGLTAA